MRGDVRSIQGTNDCLCRHVVEDSHIAVIYSDAAGLLQLWNKGCGTEERSDGSNDAIDRSSIADIVRTSRRYKLQRISGLMGEARQASAEHDFE